MKIFYEIFVLILGLVPLISFVSEEHVFQPEFFCFVLDSSALSPVIVRLIKSPLGIPRPRPVVRFPDWGLGRMRSISV